MIAEVLSCFVWHMQSPMHHTAYVSLTCVPFAEASHFVSMLTFCSHCSATSVTCVHLLAMQTCSTTTISGHPCAPCIQVVLWFECITSCMLQQQTATGVQPGYPTLCMWTDMNSCTAHRICIVWSWNRSGEKREWHTCEYTSYAQVNDGPLLPQYALYFLIRYTVVRIRAESGWTGSHAGLRIQPDTTTYTLLTDIIINTRHTMYTLTENQKYAISYTIPPTADLAFVLCKAYCNLSTT